MYPRVSNSSTRWWNASAPHSRTNTASLITSLVISLFASIPKAQRNLMPICCDDLRNPQRSCATLCSETAESDLIAGLEGFLRPACSHQVIGAGELALPLLGFALVGLRFKENHHVGIDELKVRNRALHR